MSVSGEGLRVELFGLARLVAVWFTPGSDLNSASLVDAAVRGFSDGEAFHRTLEHEHGRSRSTNRPVSAIALRCGSGVDPSRAPCKRSVHQRMLAPSMPR